MQRYVRSKNETVPRTGSTRSTLKERTEERLLLMDVKKKSEPIGHPRHL